MAASYNLSQLSAAFANRFYAQDRQCAGQARARHAVSGTSHLARNLVFFHQDLAAARRPIGWRSAKSFRIRERPSFSSRRPVIYLRNPRCVDERLDVRIAPFNAIAHFLGKPVGIVSIRRARWVALAAAKHLQNMLPAGISGRASAALIYLTAVVDRIRRQGRTHQGSAARRFLKSLSTPLPPSSTAKQ